MSSGTVLLVLHCLQLTRINFFIRPPGRTSRALEKNTPHHSITSSPESEARLRNLETCEDSALTKYHLPYIYMYSSRYKAIDSRTHQVTPSTSR